MSVHESTPFRAAIPSVEADRAVKFGVGVAAAPLWATFFTAAGAGMAYWWMSAAWARREPKLFAPAKGAAPAAVRAPAPVQAAEPAPRAPEIKALAAAAPVVAAGLEPAIERPEIAAVFAEAKPALAAPRANGADAQAPAAAARKPPVRRKSEPKA